MKRVIYALLLSLMVSVVLVSHANADWRWTKPHFKVKKFKPVCDTVQCVKLAHKRTQQHHRERLRHYNAIKQAEWREWTSIYIPDCTWYGESGTGPKYARDRYTLPNSQGSGAYGKFQFKPPTYFSVAKYRDWSPLDQEIAVRREFWKHGIFPWANCI